MPLDANLKGTTLHVEETQSSIDKEATEALLSILHDESARSFHFPIQEGKSNPLTKSSNDHPKESKSTFSRLFPRPGTPTPPPSLLANVINISSRPHLIRSAPQEIPSRKFSSSSRSEQNEENDEYEASNSFENCSSPPFESSSPRNLLSLSAPSTTLSHRSTSIKHSYSSSFEDESEIHRVSVQLSSLCVSPSELLGPFVGSFQESLLSGHMANTPSTIYDDFIADLGVCSSSKTVLPHLKIPFPAVFYHIDHDTPYVGTIPLDRKGYRVPLKGMIQLTIINPSKTPIKTFLVKYDLSDMPPGTKTFLRQKIMTSNPPILRYAVHLKFASPKKNKVYLYKNIRIAFAHRMPDDMDALSIGYDSPDDPKYFYYKSKGSSSNEKANAIKRLNHFAHSPNSSLEDLGYNSLNNSMESNGDERGSMVEEEGENGRD